MNRRSQFLAFVRTYAVLAGVSCDAAAYVFNKAWLIPEESIPLQVPQAAMEFWRYSMRTDFYENGVVPHGVPAWIDSLVDDGVWVNPA
jgi:hypothetical protein